MLDKESPASFPVVGGMRDCSQSLQGKGHHLVLKGASLGFSRVVVVSLGFHLSCDRDLREALILPQGSQVSFQVVKGSAELLLSHCRGIEPHLA